VIAQMNKLGNSDKDMKRYVVEKERQDLLTYNSIFEKQ
jgi:hypothetical protein